MPAKTWAVVLAGGEGTRIQPFIRKYLGFALPKQYFTFCGKKSMLEHTIDRAVELTHADRVITVTGNGHGRYLAMQNVRGEILEQPFARGTGAGVFLPVAHIMARDPDASVVIFPSDHFIFPKKRFLEQADVARQLAENPSLPFILLAAHPDLSETDYGWVEPGSVVAGLDPSGSASIRRVRSFREKPGADEARRCFERGDLWNTMIIAAKVKALWKLTQRLLPEITGRFDLFRRRLGRIKPAGKKRADLHLVDLYQSIPDFDFSRAFLAPAAPQFVVMPLDDILWSDWGRPERVFESLRKIGRRPSLLETARRWRLLHRSCR